MALIVEDGTAKTNAESYASVAQADTYMSDRGFTLWATMSTAEKEQALRRATDYMVQKYREMWAGTRLTSTQALDWPRYQVPMKDAPGGYGAWPSYYAQNIVPDIVRNACIFMAYKAASGDLAEDLDKPVTSETVGPISVTYAAGARQSKVYRAIDMMLAPLLAHGGSITVLRA